MKLRAGTITRRKRHGHSYDANGKRSPTYKSWTAMIDRCEREAASNYHLYGGRGITVCRRWRGRFENFLSDLGKRSDGTTLDRFPNRNGNYEPGNCRWATASQQASTRRDTSEWREKPGRVNRNKTHCKRGHPLKGKNLYINSNGSRACRECRRGYDRARRAAGRKR